MAKKKADDRRIAGEPRLKRALAGACAVLCTMVGLVSAVLDQLGTVEGRIYVALAALGFVTAIGTALLGAIRKNTGRRMPVLAMALLVAGGVALGVTFASPRSTSGDEPSPDTSATGSLADAPIVYSCVVTLGTMAAPRQEQTSRDAAGQPPGSTPDPTGGPPPTELRVDVAVGGPPADSQPGEPAQLAADDEARPDQTRDVDSPHFRNLDSVIAPTVIAVPVTPTPTPVPETPIPVAGTPTPDPTVTPTVTPSPTPIATATPAAVDADEGG